MKMNLNFVPNLGNFITVKSEIIVQRKLNYHASVNSKCAHPPQPLGIKFCQAFVILLVWWWGICQKTSAWG